MIRFFLWLSVVAFLAGSAVHVSHVLLPRVVVFPLSVMAMAPFAVAVVRMHKTRSEPGSRNFWHTIAASAPPCVRPALLFLLAYTVFNFVFSLLYLNEGFTPAAYEHRYVMLSHSTVVREITRGEYLRHAAYELRGLSTHIVLFAAVSWAVLRAEQRRVACPLS
ncbi:MAG TPA: hypothetical protein VKG92_11970 [Flavobacteriales bacterium]|nr:hypothetical protein [Flavobacteriales bacterium]